MVNSNDGNDEFQVAQATCQTDLTSAIMNKKDEELLKCKRQISILQAEILVLKEMMQTFTEKDFINDEECVKFYTGLQKHYSNLFVHLVVEIQN